MIKYLSFLQPAPYAQEIPDEQEVKTLYKYWRIRIFYSMFVGYALYYFTRKSFTFAMPGLITELGLTKGQLGLLASIFSVTYGISKFVSGIMSDRCNPRYFMALGLLITGVINIFFGFSSSLIIFAVLWGLNGWFQGFGWPPCARFLTHWYSHSERGSWWSSWNISHNIGAFLIPWIVGAIMEHYGWRYAMYFPGIVCIIGGLFLANRLRDTPQSLGLPSIEKFRDDYGGLSRKEFDEENKLSSKQIFIDYVLKNRYLWLLAFAYFFVYIVRTGINDWTSLYLQETKSYSPLVANGCVSLFEIGGIAGSLFAGWSSDYFFNSRRGPVNVTFAVGMLASIVFFWMMPVNNHWFDSIAIFAVGFFVFGPQMMIGIAAAELSHKKAASTSTGFVGTFAYIGSAVAGYPLGIAAEVWGWEGFFWFLGVCCIGSFLLLLPMWAVTDNKKIQVSST